MPAKTLSVFPNPYLHLDHEGRPAHAVPVEPPKDGSLQARAWVGAHPVAIVTAKDPQGFALDQDTWFEFDMENPVEGLTNSHYYGQAIRHGALIPADVETARAIGVDFKEPALVLAASKKAAAEKHAAHYPDEEKPTLDVHAPGTHAAKLAKATKDRAEALKPANERSTKPEPVAAVLDAEEAPRDLTPKAEARPGLVSLAAPLTTSGGDK